MSDQQVAALSTPHINAGDSFAPEHQNAVLRRENAVEGDISFSTENAVSVFDLAAEIQTDLAELRKKLDAQNQECLLAIEKALQTIEGLEADLQGPKPAK